MYAIRSGFEEKKSKPFRMPERQPVREEPKPVREAPAPKRKEREKVPA